MPGDDATAKEPDQRTTLALEIVHHAGDWSALADAAALADSAAEQIVAKLGADACGAATVVLADDAEVQRLNAAWRGKDKPTNVLSFPAAEAPGEPVFLGDVILAAETVRAEAADLGLPLAHHYQHLVIHGLLHLLGYDHEDETEAEEMEALETEILAELGVADPYAEQPETAA